MKRILVMLGALAACSCARSEEVQASQKEDSRQIERAEAPFGIDDGFSSNNDQECSSAACSNPVGN